MSAPFAPAGAVCAASAAQRQRALMEDALALNRRCIDLIDGRDAALRRALVLLRVDAAALIERLVVGDLAQGAATEGAIAALDPLEARVVRHRLAVIRAVEGFVGRDAAVAGPPWFDALLDAPTEAAGLARAQEKEPAR